MAELGFLPPGARGYLLGEQLAQQQQAQGLGRLGSLIQMQGALAQQQQAQQPSAPDEQGWITMPGGVKVRQKQD